MDEVLPGLWVGGVRAAMDVDYLSRAGVTHIVTCMKQQIPVPARLDDGRRITRAEMKHVRIDDDEKAPILVHFAGCNELIHSQLMEEWVPDSPSPDTNTNTNTDNINTDSDAAPEQWNEAGTSEKREETPAEIDEVSLLVQGRQQRSGVWGTWQTTGPGTVLIHCQAGCSRSVAIVAAYLMHTRRISARTAVSMIQRRRPDAGPNSGFMAQLELYEQVGFEIDMKWQAVRRFLMSKTDILNGDSMDDMLLSYYPSPYPSPALSKAGVRAFTAITNDDKDEGKAEGEASTPNSAVGEDVFSNPNKNSSIPPHNHHHHHHHQQYQQKPLSRSASSSSTSSSSGTQRISHLSSLAPPPSSTSSLSSRFSSMSTSVGESGEVKVTANSSGRLPGGVAQIRGHEGANNRGALPKPHFAGPKLRCKGCRRELAALDHVVIHEPGRGQMAFDHRKRDVGHAGLNVASNSGGSVGPEAAAGEAATAAGEGGEGDKEEGESKQQPAQQATNSATAAPTSAVNRRPIQSAASLASQLPPHLAALRGTRPRPPTLPQSPSSTTTTTTTIPATSAGGGMSSMLKSPLCSSYFLEPMAWMESLSSGEVTGRLNCPTPKCGQKLGSWDWAGMQCACGAWVTPAFSLHRSKVDEC